MCFWWNVQDVWLKIKNNQCLVSLLFNLASKSECERNNGNCSHFCLKNSVGISCACPVGLKLRDDGQTCNKSKCKYYLCELLKVKFVLGFTGSSPASSSCMGYKDLDMYVGVQFWDLACNLTIETLRCRSAKRRRRLKQPHSNNDSVAYRVLSIIWI